MERVQQGLPVGQISFLLRAGTDTLPTPLNLRRWHLNVDSTCSLCSSNQPTTIHHILSNCPEALQQGRYTWSLAWRHDCALLTLVNGLKGHLELDMMFHADLPKIRALDTPCLLYTSDAADE